MLLIGFAGIGSVHCNIAGAETVGVLVTDGPSHRI
jgi:hypothetical protein